MRGAMRQAATTRGTGAARGGGGARAARAVRAACVAVVFAVGTAAAQQPATVSVDAARLEPVGLQRQATGEVRSLRRALLATQVEGLVREIGVEAGDAVQAGAVIARLDDEIARLEVAQAEAELANAEGLVAQREAEASQAERDLARVRQLVDRSGASASEVDDAETLLRTAGAQLTQARAAVSGLRAALSRSRRLLADKQITAPFAGRVIAKRTEVGQWVSAGDAVVELLSETELEAWVDVPQAIVAFVAENGGRVSLEVPGLGEGAGPVWGSVVSVVPQADPLSRLFPVRLTVDSMEGRIKPGMSVTAFVPAGRVEARLTVHKDALRRDDAGEFVFVAQPYRDEKNPAVNARATAARVERIFAVGDRVAVREGALAAGTPVLTRGNERVTPGQPLIVEAPPAGAAPRAPSSGDIEPAAPGPSAGPTSGGAPSNAADADAEPHTPPAPAR